MWLIPDRDPHVPVAVSAHIVEARHARFVPWARMRGRGNSALKAEISMQDLASRGKRKPSEKDVWEQDRRYHLHPYQNFASDPLTL